MIMINALAQFAPIPLSTLYEFAIILIILVGVALAIRLLLLLFGRHILGAVLLLISSLAMAVDTIDVTSGDVNGMRLAVRTANENPSKIITVNIKPDEIGDYPPFVFDRDYEMSGNALGVLTGAMIITVADPKAPPTFIGNGSFRFVEVAGERSFLLIIGARIMGFGTDGDGGVALVRGGGRLAFRDCVLENNTAMGSGGVAKVKDTASIGVTGSTVKGNKAGDWGGAFSLPGSAPNPLLNEFNNNVFSDNQAAIGCDLDIFTQGDILISIKGSIFSSPCGRVGMINIYEGKVRSSANTFNFDSFAIDSIGQVMFFGNLFNFEIEGGNQASCNDFGSNAFESLGYNISADDSCALDHVTDLPDTDPMIEPDGDGLLVPQPGSPAIDSGPTDVIVFDGDDLASLPCGYRDLSGTARPQDANGDGVFECDRGAMEVPGAGEIVAGHSAAFFNVDRDGEGNFVEILSDSLAVVYTFTYRPDGSGPAWFVGVGDINGNSIVIDDLLRPVGTSFGDGFDKDEVERTPIGGMSMVFPDCEAADPGGNVAYSGEVELGYEGLISRATRLTNVTGCGALTPDPKAGLSGSFFDPARDGEGVIVQWLPNGQVLAIFFTYDQNDNQFWVLGQAAADGNTVTMDALYPSTHTSWGRGFNADDITLSDWGTFTLTWTDCNTMTFAYTSSVEGFGSATRSYIRLSTLSGTACPEF